METIIIKEKDILKTKQQVISYAMLYFSMYKYRRGEGSMEFDLYNLSCEIGDLWLKKGWIEEIIINDDMCSETIEDKVLEYIKENK